MSAFQRVGGTLSSGGGTGRRPGKQTQPPVGGEEERTELVGTYWRWPTAIFFFATIASFVGVVAADIATHKGNVFPLIWPVLFGLMTVRFYKARRLEFDDQVVIAHGFWRTRTFAWTQVANVEIGAKGVYFAPTLRFTNGKNYRIYAGLHRRFRNHRASIVAVAEWVDAMNKVRGVDTPPVEIETLLVRKVASPKAPEPPKPEKPSTRRWRIALAIALVAAFLFAFGIFLRNEVDDITLAHYGVVIQAQVVGHDHEDSGDSGSSDYLWIAIPACQCNVRVPTNNPGGHPDGTAIPARYDPSDPSNAQSLVDVPLQWPADLFGGGALFVFFVFPAVVILFAEWKRWRHPPPDPLEASAPDAHGQLALAADGVEPADTATETGALTPPSDPTR